MAVKKSVFVLVAFGILFLLVGLAAVRLATTGDVVKSSDNAENAEAKNSQALAVSEDSEPHIQLLGTNDSSGNQTNSTNSTTTTTRHSSGGGGGSGGSSSSSGGGGGSSSSGGSSSGSQDTGSSESGGGGSGGDSSNNDGSDDSSNGDGGDGKTYSFSFQNGGVH